MRAVIGGLALVMALAVLTPGCGRRERASQTIRQVGSTTVLPLAERWRREFNKVHPEVEIAVSGGGSGTGMKALIAGTAEIANSSRGIKAREVEEAEAAGVNPVEHVLAYDGIAVIVHPSNSLHEMSVDQLSEIFSGGVTNWGEVGAGGMGEIQVVSRDSASGTYEAFKDLVVTLGGTDKTRDYAAAALKQASNQAVLALVSKTEAAIGYVGMGYLDEGVRALKVAPMGGGEGVAATVEKAMSGEYPVSRALYCYTSGEPSGVLKEYLDWMKGAEGQRIVEELGFVPVE
ncbi:MAG: phosphate ABC transporter substrate-binding protein [Armatimonadota bacterium]|nr:MAG: phosphate ABC transporter substrate-binding protein [Armatimonadota bacterium]